MIEKKEALPMNRLPGPESASNFEQNNTLFVPRLQALALLVACLTGSGAAFWLYCAGMMLGGLLL
jgi:hypothetical protein